MRRLYRAAFVRGESGHGGAARGAACIDLSEWPVRSSCSAGNRSDAPVVCMDTGIPHGLWTAVQPVFPVQARQGILPYRPVANPQPFEASSSFIRRRSNITVGHRKATISPTTD